MKKTWNDKRTEFAFQRGKNMKLKAKAKKAICAILAAAMCSGTVVSPISAYAVTNTKPVNPDGTKPNYNKPQDMASDDQRQYADQAVRLLVSKIKTAQGAHEGIAPKTTDAKQEDTITYKISGRVEGTIQYLEEKYGTGNVEFAYDSAGHYLGYGWMKGTYEYLLNRKKAAFPEDLNFDIIYDGGVFSGYAYVTRKLATAEDANRFVAGANMALYQAIEITRDNTITNDGKDVGEDHRFNGVEVTRNSDSTIKDIRVKKGHAGTTQAYVYQKDGEDKITVDSYGYVINKNYDPKDQINDLSNGTWITKTIEREDTPILYYNLDNLHVTTNDVYTKDTVDNVFGKERQNKDTTLYAFDKERHVIDATQLNETDFSIYGFVGDETTPSFEFVGGDYDEIKYNESEKRIVVGKDTLIYHLDKDGNRDSLVDPQTGIAYIEETIDKQEGHDNIHGTNNTDSKKNTKIYVWPVNISYDGSGSTSGNKNGSKTFTKILGTRIATINADTKDEYTTGTYENGNFLKKLHPMLDLYGRTIYYKQSSETYVKGQDTWDYDGDVYTGWKYTDILDPENLNAYTINDHSTLYNGDEDDPFDQSTHYQYSKTQSIKLTVDENGYIVNGASTVPVPKKDGYGFKGWIQNVASLTDGANIYPAWSSNPNSTMTDAVKNAWYSNREASGKTKTITVTFHANGQSDPNGSAEFVSGSGDIHSTDNKLYRRLGDAFLIYNKWVSGENTPNDPFDDTKVDNTENTAAGKNTVTGTDKTANDPYSDTMSGGMGDMLKRVGIGDYIMEETSAPLGYVKGLPVGVTVNYSSEVQRAEMQDETIKLELVKVDANEKDLNKYEYYVDGVHQMTAYDAPVTKTEQKLSFTYKEVKGAVLAITGADKDSISALSSWAKVTSHPSVTTKTDKDGNAYIEVPLDTPIVLEGFPKGNYLATEVKTPSGAVTMKPASFTVTENNSVQFKNFSDDHMKVEIEKYYLGNADTITHLDNARRAELALVDENGKTVSTWMTDDLSDYKGTSEKTNTFFGKIINKVKSVLGTEEETMSFEDRFMEAYRKNQKITNIGWTVTRSAELLSGATDEKQEWLISDGTKVVCTNHSAPEDAPAAFKEAFKNIDSDTKEFNYKEEITAEKDVAISLTDSDMYWNTSNGSVIHIAAYPDESDGNVKYHYDFQYNYKDLSAYSENLVSYDKESGVHRFDYLPKGNYKIREITAPDGYVRATDKDITVNETSDIQRYMYENKGRNLRIAKYGFVNNAYYAGNTNGNAEITDDIKKAAVIPGFKFDVYYSETKLPDYQNAFSNGTLQAGVKLKDSFTTGEDGAYTEKDCKNSIIPEDKIGDYKPHELKDVENGYYYIVEKTAKAGYGKSKVVETVVTDSAADNALNVNIVDEVMPAKVKVEKEDENGALLEGAGFTIVNKTLGGTTVGYIETDASGEASIIINDPYTFNKDGSLKPYTFEISETKAPGGYALTDKQYTFTADPETIENGVTLIMNASDASIKNGTITYVDVPTTIAITKKDFDTLEEVPGTGFTVYEASFDEASKTWKPTTITKTGWTWTTTSGHEEHQLNDLSAGKTYVLTETKVPDGYVKAEDLYFKVNDAGSAIEKVWRANEENPFLSFNMDENGTIKDVTFASRQVLGTVAKVEDVDTGNSFVTGIDNSGKLTLTKNEITDGHNIKVTELIKYSDETEEVLASTQFRAELYEGKTTVALSAQLNGDNPLSYTVTDGNGKEVASWTLARDYAGLNSKHTEGNPLANSEGYVTYYKSSQFVGYDSSAVSERKQIAYEVHYTGNGKDATEITIIPNDKLNYTRINGESAGKYGPMDDKNYHVIGSKDGGSFIVTAQVSQNATGMIAQEIKIGDTTFERVNPIAVNKKKSTDKDSSLLIANEVNGNDPANSGAEFTYELTLTKKDSDKPLDGGYDFRTKSTSGRWDAFGKEKTFTFTLTGNDYLLMRNLPEGAAYEVKLINKPDGFTESTAGALKGNTGTDTVKIQYASFKHERNVENDRSVFVKGQSYIVTETLSLKDGKRDVSKYGFTLNDNDAVYDLIVLNKQTEVWFSKTDWTDCEEVPGAKCALYEKDQDGNWVPTHINGTEVSWTSGTEPTKFKGALTAGKTYRYVEVGPPEGYAYTDAVEFTVSEDGSIDKVVMQDKLTSASFTKEDFAGHEVPGATVSLKSYTVNGEASDKNVTGGTWETIDEWVSSNDCIEHPHKIEGKLTPGASYRYHEEAAPDGYAYSEDIEFTLDRNGVISDAHYIDENGQTIIYDGNGFPNEDVKAVKGEDGSYTFTMNGETLTENGNALYRPDGTKVEGTDGYKVEIEVVNNVIRMKDAPTDVAFTKEDFAGNEVPGAEVSLKKYDKETDTWKTVDKWTSEKTEEGTGKANAHEIKGTLSSGETYRYHEEAAPDGYFYSEDIEFTIDKKGRVTDAHYVDKDGNTIAYDKNGYPLETVTVKTDENGHRTFYYDGEKVDEANGTLSKGGVTIIEGIRVDIEIDGNVVRMKDAPIKVKLTKKRFGTDITLSDGIFSIVEKLSGKVAKDHFKINGVLDLTKELKAGKVYLLKENAAPDGYKKADDVEFSVPTYNTDTTIEVVMEDERVTLTPSYKMEKVRVTDAPVKTDGAYGFHRGDTVTYKVTVKNTGDMALTMNVDDAFGYGDASPETELLKSYFTNPSVDKVTFFEYDKETDEKGEENSAIGNLVEKLSENKVKISLKTNGLCEIMYKATVKDNAPEYLAPDKADNKANDMDGYRNTANTTDVTATPENPKPGDKEKYTKEDYPELSDKKDTADTPVQEPVVLTPSYEMKKERITEAPEKDETGKYGFRYGDTVTYDVTVTNTGEMPISTLVTDEFEESAKEYFGDLKITKIRFLDENDAEKAENGYEIPDGEAESYIGLDHAYIYVNTGCKAVVTYTAVVTDKAKELLSVYPNEDDNGYVNTARTSNTKGETPPTPENPNPEKPPLPPKEDDEKTPVQTPEPSYEMKKERVTEAPAKLGTAKFGFKRGDDVEYEVTVTNTGKMSLTMDVEDHFDGEEANYFTIPEFKSADFYMADGTQSSDAGMKNAASGNTANITIEPGCYAVITFHAIVKDNAPEYLAPTAKDNKEDRNDGYGNTATTTNVIAKYIDGNGNEHTFTKEDFPSLNDKHDTADTPVQENADMPNYALTKERVTPATVKVNADGKYGFMAGEKVTYKVVVTNTGKTPILTTVSDEFDKNISTYFKDLKIEAPASGKAIVFTDHTGNENDALGSVVETSGMGIGYEKVRIRLEIGGRAEIYYTAVVSDKAKELLANGATEAEDETGYLNIARTKDTVVPPTPPTPENPNPPEYPPLPPKEDDGHTPVQTPNPSYVMTKDRITPAQLKEHSDGKYGFLHGTTVEYLVTVTNTGDTTLTMNVDDKFNGSAAGYFTTPVVKSASYENGQEVPASNMGIGKNGIRITLLPSGTAKIIYTAKVLDTAPENLSKHEADDGLGYLNTASTKDVESTYTDKDGKEHKNTKEDFPDTPDNPLKDKEDTAHTPVQTKTPDYIMDKTRVSLAPKKNSRKYGFFRGDTVTYEVTATNTGDMDLTMLVDDAFDKSIAGYFEDLKITGVRFINQKTGLDENIGKLLERKDTGIGTRKAYIALNIGGKAVITYTAKVSKNAPENLSNAAKDDGLGYLNTATTTEVTGTYKDGEGKEHKVTKDDFDTLKDKKDTANTPVQVTSHGGGGSHTDETARIVVKKYDGTTGKALEGAVFEIYYPDGGLYKTVTTNVLGEAYVTIYTTGTYMYKEVKAPEGYELDSTVYPLSVNNLKTYTVNVPNTSTPKTPPETPPTPPTPEKPNEPSTPPSGKISVSYKKTYEADGGGWFDDDGKYHRFATPEKYRTGDTFDPMMIAAIAALGMTFVFAGAYVLKKKN